MEKDFGFFLNVNIKRKMTPGAEQEKSESQTEWSLTAYQREG